MSDAPRGPARQAARRSLFGFLDDETKLVRRMHSASDDLVFAVPERHAAVGRTPADELAIDGGAERAAGIDQDIAFGCLHNDEMSARKPIGALFSNHIPDYRNLMNSYSTLTQSSEKK